MSQREDSDPAHSKRVGPTHTPDPSLRPPSPGRDEPDLDLHWMERALVLAARGRCGASPNPMVGAVIVKNRKII